MKTHKVCLLVGILGVLACSGTTCPINLTGTTRGTGVPGLNDAAEISSNQAVIDIVDRIKVELRKNFFLYPDSAIDPPNVEGRYRIAGERLIPQRIPLLPGDFEWSNQTSDNHIDTDYTQFFGNSGSQTGVSRRGEIIRGTGDSFTVYSILEVQTGPCVATQLLIFTGKTTGSGVSGQYCAVVIDGSVFCADFATAGTFEFERQ